MLQVLAQVFAAIAQLVRSHTLLWAKGEQEKDA